MSPGARRPNATPADGNRRAYQSPDTVELIRRRAGWIDAAERLMINKVADEVRARPILDIGVGGGRTAWMLRPLSPEYVAVDYSPEMVEACRAEYPGLDVREGDARDLSQFADGTFALVFFSFNGIDVLDHAGRLETFAEIRRVLQPGGVLLYSTGNKNGSLYGHHPWTRAQAQGSRFARFVRFVRFVLRLPPSLPRYRRSYRNWWRQRRFTEDHGAWALCTSRAYEFAIVAHWTRPSTEHHALESVGFSVEETMSFDGSPVTDDATTALYFYVLARNTAETTLSEIR
jgi:SAM-dependent methyltransferase